VSWKEAAIANNHRDYGPYIGVVMLLIGLFFVWRSFYGMRIPREDVPEHAQRNAANPATAKAHA
jgi:hypothetical protein